MIDYFKYYDNFSLTTRNYIRIVIIIFKEFSFRPFDKKAKTFFDYNIVFKKDVNY